jgi:hypothetical protein
MTSTAIKEQCGAHWTAAPTGLQGARAFWVSLQSGRSNAKPEIVGFYAPSINAAAEALSN